MIIYRETQDDWCGNYKTESLDLVRIEYQGNISPKHSGKYVYRVEVRGTGDFGLKFDSERESISWGKFIETFIDMDYVNIDNLRELGFVSI